MRGDTPVRINASDFRYGVDELAPGEAMPRGAVARGALPPPIPEGLKTALTIDGGVAVGGSINMKDDSNDAFVMDATTAKVETGAPVRDPQRDVSREEVHAAVREGTESALEQATRLNASDKEQDEEPKVAVASPSFADVSIPDDWRDMHWKSRQKLAEEINPAFAPDPKNRVPSIDAVIEQEMAKRLAEGAK
jgi:hypothetical protein